MNERLCHDICWAHAHAMRDTVAHLLREEEHREFFASPTTDNAAHATGEAYCAQQDRELRRLVPSKN